MLHFKTVFLLVTIYVSCCHARFKYCSLTRYHIMCRFRGVEKPHVDSRSYRISKQDKLFLVILQYLLREKEAYGREQRGLAGDQPKASNMAHLVYRKVLSKSKTSFSPQNANKRAGLGDRPEEETQKLREKRAADNKTVNFYLLSNKNDGTYLESFSILNDDLIKNITDPTKEGFLKLNIEEENALQSIRDKVKKMGEKSKNKRN